jgi:hypothetical protein
MAKATRVHSTPPTSTSPTRRNILGTIAAAGATALTLAPAAAAHTLDAELIELGARFEPLVDQYYVVRKRWARSLVAAHAEHDREFGTPSERNYQ